ncbi:MAG: cytochrome c3 family protein [Planctomycetota bacterium]
MGERLVVAIRHARVILCVGLAAATSVTCSPQTRYRVSRFFFDGVPEPGALPPPPGYPGGPTRAGAEGPAQPGEQWAPARTVYAHPPYRDNRCGACHNPQTGELFRTAPEGLCRNCHPDVPGKAPYVHGPVVVSDCLFCHHYHHSYYPKLLLEESTATCFRCHDVAGLTTGPHHANAVRTACVECHDPHGGTNRFFVKRSER